LIFAFNFESRKGSSIWILPRETKNFDRHKQYSSRGLFLSYFSSLDSRNLKPKFRLALVVEKQTVIFIWTLSVIYLLLFWSSCFQRNRTFCASKKNCKIRNSGFEMTKTVNRMLLVNFLRRCTFSIKVLVCEFFEMIKDVTRKLFGKLFTESQRSCREILCVWIFIGSDLGFKNYLGGKFWSLISSARKEITNLYFTEWKLQPCFSWLWSRFCRQWLSMRKFHVEFYCIYSAGWCKSTTCWSKKYHLTFFRVNTKKVHLNEKFTPC
jgi:hypothetical protein